jgi:hypothetical protein
MRMDEKYLKQKVPKNFSVSIEVFEKLKHLTLIHKAKSNSEMLERLVQDAFMTQQFEQEDN